jgi:ATP-dependent helicase/nuclease subunit B
MTYIAIISAVNRRRIRRARTWLEGRAPADELLVVGATLDAANELVRSVAKGRAAVFGWHRLTLSQLAVAIAAPMLAARALTSLGQIGTEAIVARIVHRLHEEGRLRRYHTVAAAPGFPRAVSRVITELGLARLPRDAIAGAVPDLVPLIETYEAELRDAAWSSRAPSPMMENGVQDEAEHRAGGSTIPTATR